MGANGGIDRIGTTSSDGADAVVIGCGVLGLSIARHLAASGVTVVAVDRRGPGEQTSARAAGQSVIAQTDPAMGSLMHRSIGHITGFTDRTGIPLPYHQVGSLKYACSEWAARQLEREVRRAGALGARVSLVDLNAAGELAPHTDPRAAVAAWHAPDDVYFNPMDLARATHRAALAAGVAFRFGVDVTGLVSRGGRVTGLRTTDGEFAAATVVVASGSWSAPLLATAGVGPLPLVFVRHQYSIRTGVRDIRPELPSVRVVDHAVYARPVGIDLMFGTYEPNPMVYEAAPPARALDVRLDPAATNDALTRVGALFPGAVSSTIREMRGGVVSMTPDGRYLIDEAPGVAGLFLVTGCNVMGLSASPAIGEDLAEWITSGRRPDSLAGFGLGRFDGTDLSPGVVRRRGLERYEAIYRDEESAPQVRAYAPSGGGQ